MHLNLLYVSQLGDFRGETESLIYTHVIYNIMKEEIDKIIKVTLSTREKLKLWGSKGQTYEDVITQMFVELEGDRKDMRAEG